MVLKKFYVKAKRFPSKVWERLRLRRGPDVVVSGLQDEETVFKESISKECANALKKIRNKLPEAQSLSVHVKSSHRGKGKLFELRGTLRLPGGELKASANGRDLYVALSRVLYEFQEEVRRVKSFKDEKRKRG